MLGRTRSGWNSFWWECRMVQLLRETVGQFLKIKITSITPSHSTSGYLPRESKIDVHTDLYVNGHSNFICNNPKLERTHMSFHIQMDKQIIYLAILRICY